MEQPLLNIEESIGSPAKSRTASWRPQSMRRTSGNTVLVWDFRKTGPPVHQFRTQASPHFAGWSPDGSCLLVSQDIGHQIFDVSSGVKLSAETLKYSHSATYGCHHQELPVLGGDLWCSWQGSTAFQISMNSANNIKKKIITAVNCNK